MDPLASDNSHNGGDEFRPPRVPNANPGHTPEEWNPYQATWTETRSVYQSQTVSALSILSMISGILSLPLICLCFVSLPFSMFAVVSGHVARSIIRRGQGSVTGDGMAVTGLVFGYLSLLITVSMLAFWGIAASSTARFTPPVAATPANVTQSLESTEELDQAIAMLSLSMSMGRTEEAGKLARHLQDSLQDLARQLASEGVGRGDRPVGADEGQPAESDVVAELPDNSPSTVSTLADSLISCDVYCELQTERCAFLIHVPNYSALEENDKSQLAKLVWLSSGRTLDGHREEGCELAVGLVSSAQLIEVSMGHFEASEEFDAGLQYRGPVDEPDIRMAIEDFFAPAVVEPVAAEEMPESALAPEIE